MIQSAVQSTDEARSDGYGAGRFAGILKILSKELKRGVRWLHASRKDATIAREKDRMQERTKETVR